MNAFCSRLGRAVGFAVLLMATIFIFSQPGVGQLLQGTLDGYVTDPNQAAVVGATITVTNQATNFGRDAVTNSQGGFTFVTLEPGTYTLTVKVSGFASYTKNGIVVNGNEVTRSDLTLSVGQVSQNVTVSAQASVLQVDRADVRSDLTAKSLSNLPIPLGRNYQQILAVVTPGISTPQSGQSFGANPTRAVALTVNGISIGTNSYRVDGTSSTNYNSVGNPMYSPALDAIENVNAVTNSYDAEQGLAGGISVNITTKSGTNSIHGSLFEFHTDRAFQAYQWNANGALPKPEYINNQFGATIGGPIKKDKIFYFVSYQGTYVNVGNALYAENPTAAMKAGDLSASPTPIYDPTTGDEKDCVAGGNAKLCGTGRTPFPGNVIPQSRVDPGIQALLNYAPWPNPNAPGTGSLGLSRNYLSTGVTDENQNQWDTKLSWNQSSKLSMFARFGLNDVSWSNPQQYGVLGGPGFSASNTAVGNGIGHIYSGTVSGTYIFGPTLIADAYYGYTRNNAQAVQDNLNQNLGWTLMGIPGLQSSDVREGGLPSLQIDGFGGTGSNIPEATLGPSNNFQPEYYFNVEKEWVGNVTWVKHTHNLRAGVDFDQQQDNEDFEEATNCNYCTGSGGFQFSQGSTQLNGGAAGNDYNAFASFLLGLSSNAGKVSLIPPEYHDYQDILGFYVRDQWQVNPKLTVTYGTRWDYYPFPNRGSRGMEYLDVATNQMIICGVAGNPRNCGITKDNQRFEPRAGVAYRIHDATVFRAGYALSTDPTNTGGVLGNRQNFPDNVTSTIPTTNSFAYATSLRSGLPPIVIPDYSSGRVAVPLTTGVFTVDNQTYVRGYIQSWNATLEQQVPGWLISIGYVATRFINPQSVINENWGTIGTGSAGQVLTQLTGRTATTSGIGRYGTNKYDGLQASATHAFAHNFQIVAAYTFAKGLAYASPGAAIPAYYRLNYGNTAGLARNTAGIALIAASPFGANQMWMTSGLGGHILGRWQFEAVSTLRTGTPFTVTGSNTTLNASGSTQFAQCIGQPTKLGGIRQWYNKSSFAEPATGTFGNCGTDTLWGPGLNTLDTALSRTFPVFRESTMEFRANMFNTPNNPHHANPTSSLTSSSFMQALGIANTGRDGIDQRTVQLSLRLVF
jgi:Carboxypeptidase regulatory-like domain/TonB dependent receptor